jgi:hypothetical protein
MNIDQIYPSKYLKESDLQGRDVTVTIRDVQVVKIGEDKKPVAFFEGKEKGLVLNKTLLNVIAKVTDSKDTDNWPGKRITLYPTETEYRGDVVACIRVRLRTNDSGQSAPSTPPPAAKLDPKDVPF